MNKVKNSQIVSSVKDLLRDFDPRSKDVLEKRYGLQGTEPLTLAEIGNEYHITRERVRQIEAIALKEVRGKLAKSSLNGVIQAAISALKNFKGVRRMDLLVSDIQNNLKDEAGETLLTNNLQFILEASGKLTYRAEDDEWHAHWASDEGAEKTAHAFVAKSYDTLKKNASALLAGKSFSEFLGQLIRPEKVSEPVAMGYLELSKKFARNQFSDFGLSEWVEINPKTARDWAYLILKKEKKPLHFQEIAEKISAYRTNKRTNFQTVHNELIKDERFVLVGRGLYGLREFGYLPGTAKEVIAHFLKKHGPMNFMDLKKRITEERAFKENTFLINIQNKDFFKKLNDGRYTLSEV